MHCTKISSEFECQSQRSKVKGQGHRGQKTKKCAILFGSRPLGRGRPSVLRRCENQRMLSICNCVQLQYCACEHTPSVSHFFGLVCKYMNFAVEMTDTVVFYLFFR